jgi:hypothetical protein
MKRPHGNFVDEETDENGGRGKQHIIYETDSLGVPTVPAVLGKPSPRQHTERDCQDHCANTHQNRTEDGVAQSARDAGRGGILCEHGQVETAKSIAEQRCKNRSECEQRHQCGECTGGNE